MRVVFAGTPEFALVALKRLKESGFEMVLVLTQPDRPSGRGMRAQASPVKTYALQHQLKLLQAAGLGKRFPDEAQALRAAMVQADADVMVVAAYGLLLPAWLLELPRLGCMNIHASLLPRWRGAAPIQRAIEAGDRETGISIMQMDSGLDTGAVLMARSLPILETDNSASLHDKLAELAADLMVQTLRHCAEQPLSAVAQPRAGVSYAAKIEKTEAQIDWSAPAQLIERRIRAFDPFPGATMRIGEETFKVWGATPIAMPLASGTKPGTVLTVAPDGIVVAAADAPMRLTRLQRAGGRRLDVGDFLRGFELRPGAVLGE